MLQISQDLVSDFEVAFGEMKAASLDAQQT